MFKSFRLQVLALIVGSLLVPAALSAGTIVNLELLLLVDVSGSVDASEYNLQKTGYVNAFKSAAIQTAIANSPGGIAVAYGVWSTFNQQNLQVAWTHVTDAASANAFANLIAATTQIFGNSTAPGSAINWGVSLFASNAYDGTFKTIDISGDGAQNAGDDTSTAAAAAWAAGIKVNGLPILGDEANLQTWYQTNIVTPGHGQLWVADSFADFGTAVTAKIGQEISDPGGAVPEPGTWAMLGGGLALLALWRRRLA